MSSKSGIEWTEATWHAITAAKRIGVSTDEYIERRRNGEKWCTTCKDWHSISLFSSDKSRGDGLAATCRGKSKRQPVQLRLFKHHEKKERARETYRRYYAGPAGALIRAQKTARKRGIDPVPEWWRVETLAEGCAYCGEAATTLDHVIPVSLGGPTNPGNLVPACRSCNSKKKNSDPRPWIAIMRDPFVERICVQPMHGIGAIEFLECVA